MFCSGENNFVMHFLLRGILKTAMKGEITDAEKSNENIFTLSAESKTQVDDWAKEVNGSIIIL